MKKRKYFVELKLDAFYGDIKADSFEEALEKAYQWFSEAVPTVVDYGVKESDEE